MNSGSLLLPGIQRSFVWKPDKICRLFDSIVRDYPIGLMLLWKVTPTSTEQMGFRKFHNEVSPDQIQTTAALITPGKQVTAVLDGQQRLTALFVGVTGGYKLWGSVHRLYLDLDLENADATADELRYGFRFLSAETAKARPWAIPVRDAWGLTTEAKFDSYCQKRGIAGSRRAQLGRLRSRVHERPLVLFRYESSGDLDRILGIFSRINKGATTLSSADLLLSVATATWKPDHHDGDAFSRIEDLRGTMNAVGEGFNFTVDRLIKAGLVLIGESQPSFHASTFKKTVGRKLEKEWPDIARALEVAVRLLQSFGLSGRSLIAQNVVIPVASYAYVRGLPATYVAQMTKPKSADRAKIQSFVARTLLLPSYWTGAVDPVLVECHRLIQKHATSGFPIRELEVGLTRKKKPISVSKQRIEELLDTTYGKPQAFLLLRLLYPDVVQTTKLHKDHVYPQKVFGDSYLKKQGLSAAKAIRWKDLVDRLPNLQLLQDAHNTVDKRAKLPADWLASVAPKQRRQYRLQDLDLLPELASFEEFYDRRRSLMHERLQNLVTRI
jgi:hypothetical protein